MASVDGTGVVLTDHAVVLAAVYGSAVGTFVLGLVGLMCGSTNEVQIARRAVLWVRISCTVAIIAWLCELYTEVAQPRLRRIEWPHFGLLLPPLAVAVTFIGIFVNSHPVFRWVAMLTQPLFVLCSGMASAFVFLRMQCLDSGECLARPGEALSEIEVWVSLVSYLVAGFCGIYIVLFTGYLQASLGACGLRYPARLLSTSAGASGIVIEDPNDAIEAKESKKLEAARGAAAAVVSEASGGKRSARRRGGSQKGGGSSSGRGTAAAVAEP